MVLRIPRIPHVSLYLMVCWTCTCLSVIVISAGHQAPIISIIQSHNNTNITKPFTFTNTSHLVVSRNITYFALKCEATYPVMWSLPSLEQPWVVGTSSERIVRSFNDSSTYTYSMSVKLRNMAMPSQFTETFTCHKADLTTDVRDSPSFLDEMELKSSLAIVWESRTWPYLSAVKNNYRNGSYQIYWKEDTSPSPKIILIPCYSLNVQETKVDLYRKEANQTLTFLDHRLNSNLLLKFEPYIGFFLNSSTIQHEAEEVYECHARRVEAPNLTATTTTPRPSASVASVPAPNKTSTDLKNLLDEYSWLEEELTDYMYDLEDLDGNSTESTTVQHTTPGTKVVGSLSALIFTIVKLNTTINMTIEHVDGEIKDVLASYLNRTNDNLLLTVADNPSTSTHATCCTRVGSYPAFTSDNILFRYQKCLEPLMCLTRNHVLKTVYVPYYSRDDAYLSPRCRSMSRLVVDDFNPNVYICHMRIDRKYSRASYGGHFEPNTEFYDTASLVPDSNHSTYIQFEYQSINDNHKKRQWSPAVLNTTFYIGDIVQLRCKASPFLYATGIIWEQQWQNGTRQFIHANHTITSVVPHSIQLVDNQLRKVSCHVPPWNSTNWVTQSLTMTVQASSAPVSASNNGSVGIVQEYVTFYTRQSAILQCDFEGYPPPKFRWNVTSSDSPLASNYILENAGAKSYPFEQSRNTTVSINSGWNAAITSTEVIPSREVSCTASNVAGNATKVFNVQAIRSFSPVIHQSSREVLVLFLNDENSFLNCSITQGVPLPEFSWTKHGINVSTLDNYNAVMSPDVSTLFLDKVRYEDEGEYSCLAKNFVGFSVKEFSVRVRERPHSRFWYEFTLAILSIALIIMFGFLAYVYISKSKKINRLEMRAEYSKSLDKHESRITLATNLDDLM